MAKKLGTGSVAQDSGSSKWAQGVKSQVATATEPRGLNARYLPLTQIALDPDNPRRLAIDLDKINDIRELHPLKQEWLDSSTTTEWWDDYESAVGRYIQGKALSDFRSIALLALGIKTSDRLLNPVTVYALGSGTMLQLIAGERRFLAHALLGETHIASRILTEAPDEVEKARLQWEENNLRVGLDFSEQYYNLKKLIDGWEAAEGDRMSVGQLVSLAALPRVSAHRFLKVIRHPSPLLRAAINNGDVTSLRSAAELASAPNIKTALAPKKDIPKRPSSCFSIKPQADYQPVKQVLYAAAQSLGGDEYREMLQGKELDTPQALAEAFDQLIVHVSKGMANNAS